MSKRIIGFLLIFFLIASCNGKVPGADARKIPPNAKDRIRQNIEEGRGLTLMGATKKKMLGNLILLAQMNYGERH